MEPGGASGGTPEAIGFPCRSIPAMERPPFGTVIDLDDAAVGGTLTPSVPARSRGAWMRPSLNILDAELIERILDEAKRVLAEVGMEIRGPEMRRRLLEAGLPLDHSGTRVLFPRDVVERAVASAPSSFTLYDREGNPHAELGGDHVHFVPGSS